MVHSFRLKRTFPNQILLFVLAILACYFLSVIQSTENVVDDDLKVKSYMSERTPYYIENEEDDAIRHILEGKYDHDPLKFRFNDPDDYSFPSPISVTHHLKEDYSTYFYPPTEEVYT